MPIAGSVEMVDGGRAGRNGARSCVASGGGSCAAAIVKYARGLDNVSIYVAIAAC